MADSPIILVIEDDRLVQSMIDEILTRSGFDTAIAPSGEEAITLLRGKSIPYRALISDINLRGKADGWEVARVAREIDPEFPVIYITSAAGHDWASKSVPGSVLLLKPFTPARLVGALSRLLDPAATDRG
ncbi:MAG TPA: response regulator [Bradyrhizobium sp.]|nr:response regulator [Bradyrhizobium sp.]